MINNERIGRAIRTLRIKAGYTQKELADRLFISAMAVSKWERGLNVPDVETLRRLAVILDMDVDGLIDGTASYLDDSWHGVLMLDGETAATAETPLWDKPLIDYLISYYLLAGVRDVRIVCTQKERDYIGHRFREGEALGIQLCFSTPDAEEPPTDAPQKCRNLMLVTEPFFMYGVDLTRFIQRAMQHRSDIVNMTSVVGAGGKPIAEGFSQYLYQSLPVYFLQAEQSARTVYFREELTRRSVRPEPMDKGFLVSALKSNEDVQRVSTLIRSIEELGKYLIYCPLEIAWRRGMIEKEQMKKEAAGFPEYREYINSLL